MIDMLEYNALRPVANYPTYPPYHKGDYLEEFFFKFYLKNKTDFDATGYQYIPIYWTNVYIENINRDKIQPYLDSLPEGKYFTISQHDDAVQEKLPSGTLSFEAGGNGNGIPIPLICSSIEDNISEIQKDIFCSFVGSSSCSLRDKMIFDLQQDATFYFSIQNWTNQVSKDRENHFRDITKRSFFTLCPRGYGAQSFRIYEALQLDSIPVIIYDKSWFPFSNLIDWNSFCIPIHINEINKLKDILTSFTSEQYNAMLQQGKIIYNQYFTLEAVSKQILAVLKG